MPKKYYFFIIFIITIFMIFGVRTYNLAFANHDYYNNEAQKINEVYISGASAPRGRILDINGNILVDNQGINNIYYHKSSAITLEDELKIALKLAQLTNYQYNYDEDKLKDFYLVIHSSTASQLITDTEYELYNERKLDSDDLKQLKLDRITEQMLDELTYDEKYSSYFYFLMNEGYIYDNKLLLENITDELYASIIEANLKGVFGEIAWERKYNYDETLKSIFGLISTNLPEEKAYLLEEGYSLIDKVGISGLEEYYEEYLRGEKAIYKVENDNSLTLIKEASRGNDLILEIDIELQLEVEKIMKEQIIKAKKTANTEYYKESYVLISNPNTGAIKAIAGLRLNETSKEPTFADVSINVIKNAYTVGSAVKGASMAVGYANNIIDINTKMTDGCVKLANIPAKCSYKRLGTLNDIKALALSSNYYQFIIALGIMGQDYRYNMEVQATEEHFNIYRDTFAAFGLGTTTGIDLPNESSGLKGTKIAPDLLMNLAIGQYDLYTPSSMLQYINTIANDGKRIKLSLMHSVVNDKEIIIENEAQVLNELTLEDKYLQRIQEGFKSVMTSGTGYWYINNSIAAAGKTGTSESYIDSDYDGNMDAYVLSNTFIMYAPYDNPLYSLVVISPNTADLKTSSSYRSPVNRLIARNINDFLFSS